MTKKNPVRLVAITSVIMLAALLFGLYPEKPRTAVAVNTPVHSAMTHAIE